MDLFAADPSANLLPSDGTVRYCGRIFAETEADGYLVALLGGIRWEHDVAVMFGKEIVTKRKVAWYGDSEFDYTYSGTTKRALPWTEELGEIKFIVEEAGGAEFNSCLLNLYHDGSEGMAWHSDDERELVEGAAIGSVSFGAERNFCFKHKRSGEVVGVLLEHGSLLVMEGATQKNWVHRLPPTKKVKEARVNLTFRRMAV